MKTCHSIKRAEERYYISGFNPLDVLKKIINDQCLFIKSDYEKDSQVFLLLYKNKYLKVATNYNINYVKTVLPFDIDFDLINKLVQKISK